ncbi:MAG: hypothetical protein ACR2FI_02575 [Burkholderiales bacterium]
MILSEINLIAIRACGGLARPKLFTWQRCAAQTLAVYKMALAAR